MDPKPGLRTPKPTDEPAPKGSQGAEAPADSPLPSNIPQRAAQSFNDTLPAASSQQITSPGIKPDDTRQINPTGAVAEKPAVKAGAATKPLKSDGTVPDSAKSATVRPAKTVAESLGATGKFTEPPQHDTTKRLAESAATSGGSRQKANSDAAANEPVAGQVFGDFRLDKKLGEGGMGAVYKAHQISMDRTVALKMLTKKLAANPGFVDRFYREARTMAKLDHPNIVRGYAVGDNDGQHFVAMEFIDGQSMQKWMDQLGKLSVADSVHVVLCAAYALQHAHEQKLVHRDIKPDNILITKSGVVKVADLGLAKNTDDDMSLTQSGTGFGTPFYMPLEQYRDAKHVDARADIYALGVTLYYFLTGKLPFRGETHFDVLKAKESAKFIAARRHNPEIPERLDLMVDKMIQKERSHRYESCAEVIDALESLELASQFPTFVGAAPRTTTKGGAAPTVRATTMAPRTKPASPATAAPETPDLWLLRYRDERGQKVKKQVSSGRLKQLIERDEIDLTTATVTRVGENTQRPLVSISEFASLVQSKLVKAKADRRSQKLDTAYAKIERDAKRQRIFKAVDNFFRNLTSVIILVAVITALVVGGWWIFHNKDSVLQKVQDAAKSVQDSNSGGSPPPTTQP